MKLFFRIDIPRRSMQRSPLAVEMTPETFVVHRLDQIGMEIMRDYPELLNKHFDAILTPLNGDKSLTYEFFAGILSSIFNEKLAYGLTNSVFSKIALVLYLTREIIYTGSVNEMQTELIVDYVTKFVNENASDDVTEEGGWVSSLDILAHFSYLKPSYR